MKKSLLAIALTVAAFGASAHVRPYTHYHADDGRVVIGNTIAPEVEVTTETNRNGREVRVTTTTTCTDTRINRRNHHLICVEEETSVQREIVRRRGPYNTPNGGYQGNQGNQWNNGNAVVVPRIQRYVEVDSQGNRVIVTVTDTCTRSGFQGDEAVCYRWERDVDRQPVRWNRDRNNLDLDGDGKTNAWEQLLYQGFRNVIENNN